MNRPGVDVPCCLASARCAYADVALDSSACELNPTPHPHRQESPVTEPVFVDRSTASDTEWLQAVGPFHTEAERVTLTSGASAPNDLRAYLLRQVAAAAAELAEADRELAAAHDQARQAGFTTAEINDWTERP